MWVEVTIYDEDENQYLVSVYCCVGKPDPSVGYTGGVTAFNVEDDAGFPGGEAEVYQYLAENLHLLNEACDAA